MNRQLALREKIARLADGYPPRVLDLFAGCGGISLGFQAAGFEISGAVEHDSFAAASHSLNFHPGQNAHAVSYDIIETKPSILAKELSLGRTATSIDVVVGGPPCQAFARVGRSKLREIDEHPEAFKLDSRAQLYIHYLAFVDAFCPLALLMENVPDVINHGGQNVPEEICDVLRRKGYIAKYSLLNSAYYGVPQTRERMFLIAYHNSISEKIRFPEPTHWIDLPKGYESSRQVALKAIKDKDLFNAAHHYQVPPEASRDLPSAVTAYEAIGDLPPITLHLEGKLRRGARRFNEKIPYDNRRRISRYAQLMRSWPGFEAGDGLYDHVIRYLPRDWKLFQRMAAGDQYPEAYDLAERMFRDELARRRRHGERIPRDSAMYRSLRREFVPPYDKGKFPNKWRKMWRDKPARTLMAHLGKDGYSHIHYDSSQARTISVREAARLQSFPDGFRFEGTMNPAFRQIGNAVPPLLAKAIAEVIREQLDEGVKLHEAKDCVKEAVGV